MRTLLAGLVVAAAGVWAAAAVGVLYLSGALSPPPLATTADASSAELPERDVPGSDLAGLPRVPGSVRIEFTESVQGISRVTEAEYLVDTPLAQVVEHFEATFRAEGWTVRSASQVRGEWIYEVDSPRGVSAAIEIEPVERLIEVEIEAHETMAEGDLP